MTTITTPSSLALAPSLETAWQDVDSSFERFCLTAGIEAIEQMLCEDTQQLAGAPHNRGGGRIGHRWGRTKGKIGFHGGKVARKVAEDHREPQAATKYDELRLRAIGAQREALHRLRAQGKIGGEAFRRIQEELDWSELDAAPAGSFQSLAS